VSAQSYLIRDEVDRRYALRAVSDAAYGKEVRVDWPKRTVDQNRRMWAMLTVIANAHPKFGPRDDWEPDDWKKILLQAWLTEAGMPVGGLYPGLNGGIVVLDELTTSKLTVDQMAQFQESILAWMDTHDPPIVWEERDSEEGRT
jgi:hypothetical protein